ncbi:DUF397 domain-containing protein [Streptomyces prunicolor]|uniref:DUF397 domain-containing protein n=1 Tax=Streptomyces prunicolor TaxID=67348 RepID=UPI00342EF567
MISATSLPEEAWRASSYSSNNGGACVEVADRLPFVPVRDSKDKGGAALMFGTAAWSSFVGSVK